MTFEIFHHAEFYYSIQDLVVSCSRCQHHAPCRHLVCFYRMGHDYRILQDYNKHVRSVQGLDQTCFLRCQVRKTMRFPKIVIFFQGLPSPDSIVHPLTYVVLFSLAVHGLHGSSSLRTFTGYIIRIPMSRATPPIRIGQVSGGMTVVPAKWLTRSLLVV